MPSKHWVIDSGLTVASDRKFANTSYSTCIFLRVSSICLTSLIYAVWDVRVVDFGLEIIR